MRKRRINGVFRYSGAISAAPPAKRRTSAGKRFFHIAAGKRVLFSVAVVAPEGGDAPVVGRLSLFGEKAAGDAAFTVAVVRHAFAAFAVTGAWVGAGTGTGVFACRHGIFLLFLRAQPACAAAEPFFVSVSPAFMIPRGGASVKTGARVRRVPAYAPGIGCGHRNYANKIFYIPRVQGV